MGNMKDEAEKPVVAKGEKTESTPFHEGPRALLQEAKVEPKQEAKPELKPAKAEPAVVDLTAKPVEIAPAKTGKAAATTEAPKGIERASALMDVPLGQVPQMRGRDQGIDPLKAIVATGIAAAFGDALPQPTEVFLPGRPGDARQANQIAIGDRVYQTGFGPGGRTNALSFTSPDGASSLEMVRDGNGNLVVSKATGDFQPRDGRINLEGIPVQVGPDGRVVGDVTFNSKGDILYKTSNDKNRIEYLRRDNGTLVMTDFANWHRTSLTKDGLAQENYWDGFEWRNGQPSADGSKIDFVPPDPAKPLSIQRQIGAGVDKTTITYDDGTTFACDWIARTQLETTPGPPPRSVTLYYNGESYQEAKNVYANQPNNGDTTIEFKDPAVGTPMKSIVRADGSSTLLRADNTVVEKNSDGYVDSVTGPRGQWKFQRDANGDICRYMHSYTGADGSPQTEVMTRSGAEQNPGMEYWLSRQGYNRAREPLDIPPRDPNRPTGFNTFVGYDGQPRNMNINVTADGTVRFEEGSVEAPVFAYEEPGHDRYRDGGTQYVSEHPGGVTETIDKASGVSTFKFNRNGQDFNLSSADGPCQVLPDGTVLQDVKAKQARSLYLPNGVVATMMSDGGTPPKGVLKEVNMPGKNGKYFTLKDGANGISNMSLLEGGLVAATVTKDKTSVQTVFNAADGTRSEAGAGDKFWRVSDADGRFIGNASTPGQAVWKVSDNGISGPGGATYDSANWAPANPAIGENGEMLLVGVGNNVGNTAQLDLSGVSMIVNGTSNTYNYPDKTSARYENGKLSKLTAGQNAYSPVTAEGTDADQGPIVGLLDASGKRLQPQAGAAFHFDKATGKFVTAAETNNGVQTATIWDPATDTYTIDRKWQNASGQLASMSVTLNSQNQVSKFKLPNSSAVVSLAGNASIKGAAYDRNSAVLNIALANGLIGVFKPDGSYEWKNPDGSAASV